MGLGVTPEPVVTPAWSTQLWCYGKESIVSRLSQGDAMNWIVSLLHSSRVVSFKIRAITWGSNVDRIEAVW